MSLNDTQLTKALSPLGEHVIKIGEHCYDCPKCLAHGSDMQKYNLQVDSKNNRFNCWSCHYKGSLKKLIEDYGDHEYLVFFKSVERETPKSENTVLISAPTHLIPVIKEPSAYQYLTGERKVKKEIIKERNISYCYSGKYKGCIIFISYDEENKVEYFIAHDYKQGIYHMPLGKGTKNIVFWKKYLNPYFPIGVTEGIYDALSIPNSFPMFNTSLLPAGLEFLAKKKSFIALDKNVKKTVLTTLKKQLDSVCESVSILDWEYEIEDLNKLRIHKPDVLKQIIKDLYIKMLKIR